MSNRALRISPTWDKAGMTFEPPPKSSQLPAIAAGNSPNTWDYLGYLRISSHGLRVGPDLRNPKDRS